MNKRHTMLPVIMVIVVALLALFAIYSERSNDPGVVGDSRYPFHICTINEYCDGASCSRDPISFVVYLEHGDGNPRLDMPRMNPAATMTPIASGLAFSSNGSDVSGTLNIYTDRQLEFVGTSGSGQDAVEHYASGSCERLRTP